MKSDHAALLNDYEARIKVREVLQAFRYLLTHASTLEGYTCFPKPHGYIRSFRYMRESAWPFSFIVNQKSLLFYIRRPGLSHSAANATELQRTFADVEQNKRDEITIRIETEADARALTRILFGSTLDTRHP